MLFFKFILPFKGYSIASIFYTLVIVTVCSCISSYIISQWSYLANVVMVLSLRDQQDVSGYSFKKPLSMALGEGSCAWRMSSVESNRSIMWKLYILKAYFVLHPYVSSVWNSLLIQSTLYNHSNYQTLSKKSASLTSTVFFNKFNINRNVYG